jgi:hypothetical protein
LHVILGRVARLASERGGGDAEGFEQVVGALDVEIVGGDAGDDLRDGEQDGTMILDDRQHEGHEVVVEIAVGVAVGVRAAGGVVIVAEGAFTERGRAALVAGGVDVAAADAGDGDGFGGWRFGFCFGDGCGGYV